ncbi:hypothetical protein [Pleomorphovibrio marinus]|uniref:hypothetical protein n=1 Tax=Pleomorphovibrio marinus TaxID=2164132 RepID=UPI000E0CBCAA|nr:hypothetical protein [Pleomorphovibrio marinus]
MFEKILEKLKNKYTNMGFSEKAFKGVADYLSATVSEEDQIETSVEGVEKLLKAFQGDIDKRVTDAVAKAKAEKEKKAEDGGNEGKGSKQEDPPGEKKKTDEIPAWAQQMMETNKALSEKLQSMETGNLKENRKNILKKKLEGAPEKITSKILKDFERMNFEDEDSFNSYVTETSEEVEQIKQDFSNDGLRGFGAPKKAGANGKKEASKEEVEDITDSIMNNK